MNDKPDEREGKRKCELCGRFFQHIELSRCNHSGKIICIDCIQEEKGCGCSDE